MEEELQIRKGQNESYAVGLESMKYQHKFVIFNIYTDRHRYIISVFMQEFNTSLIAQLAKNLPAMQDLPDSGIEPGSPTLQAESLTSEYTREYIQFSSVAQSCLTLCDPMNRSMPGFPVHHHIPSPPKPMSIESVMPSSHLILCHPLSLLSPISPSIRVFSNESALCMRWPKYWSFLTTY